MSNIRWYTRYGGYVCHFLDLVTPEESAQEDIGPERISRLYDCALNRSKPFGGKKFHNRAFGGGVRFLDIEGARAVQTLLGKESSMQDYGSAHV